jgi:hypothetical protein
MKNKVLKYYMVAFCFCSTLGLLAQEPGSTGDGNGGLEGADAPAAPIDNYVWVMILIGLTYVFFKYKTIHTREI